MSILNGNPVDALNPADPGSDLGEANDANAEPGSLGASPFPMRHTSAPRISAPTSRMRRTNTSLPSVDQDLPSIPTPIEWAEVEKYFKR